MFQQKVMKSLPNISVVMCTYNGEKYLSEQLDSILGQSLPPYEVIVQDDGSSDHTWTILQSYASRFPVVKLFRNEAEHGINGNFFSAMRRASGHLLAVSDQDDVWHPDKLKEQAAAIGNKLMCICRSEPFCQQGKERKLLPYDRRRPSCNLVRMLYTGFSGHCLLFRRQLLDLVPPSGPIYRQTWYDVILSQTAAAYDSVVLLDKQLALWRRYDEAASFKPRDDRQQRGMVNALYMLRFGWTHWHEVKPVMCRHFRLRQEFLKSVHPTPSPAIYRDAVKLLGYESDSRWWKVFSLMRLYLKYRHQMFYSYEKDPVAMVRALLQPWMQIYLYYQRYMTH